MLIQYVGNVFLSLLHTQYQKCHFQAVYKSITDVLAIRSYCTERDWNAFDSGGITDLVMVYIFFFSNILQARKCALGKLCTKMQCDFNTYTAHCFTLFLLQGLIPLHEVARFTANAALPKFIRK